MVNRTYHPRGLKINGFDCGDHPLYMIWENMLSRCNNPKSKSYKNYGGYIVRATVKGERYYLGYYKTLERASNARRSFLEK